MENSIRNICNEEKYRFKSFICFKDENTLRNYNNFSQVEIMQLRISFASLIPYTKNEGRKRRFKKLFEYEATQPLVPLIFHHRRGIIHPKRDHRSNR